MNDMSPVAMPDVLSRICAETRIETDRRRGLVPLAALQDAAIEVAEPRGFAHALMRASNDSGTALIAEIKRQSPSNGAIRPGLDVAEIARAYEAGGATCLSVLTDGPHFGGSLDDLRAAAAATKMPILRKDFILDPYQVFESRAAGADCILLIMSAITDAEARDLEEIARSLDMDVLAEVHDRRELDRAMGLQTKLIGVNNRDLRTFRVDVQTSVDLAADVPCDRFLVSESGIGSADDIHLLRKAGIFAFLVGESLLRQADVAQAARALLA